MGGIDSPNPSVYQRNMKKLLSPKTDIVFKMLFETDEEILADLIDCVLDLPENRRVRSVRVKNPGILPDEIGKKFIVLDIRAEDESGEQFDVEMRVRKYESYSKRSLFYLCKLYAEQLGSGKDYGELKPAVGIHFLDCERNGAFCAVAIDCRTARRHGAEFFGNAYLQKNIGVEHDVLLVDAFHCLEDLGSSGLRTAYGFRYGRFACGFVETAFRIGGRLASVRVVFQVPVLRIGNQLGLEGEPVAVAVVFHHAGRRDFQGGTFIDGPGVVCGKGPVGNDFHPSIHKIALDALAVRVSERRRRGFGKSHDRNLRILHGLAGRRERHGGHRAVGDKLERLHEVEDGDIDLAIRSDGS